MKLNHAEIANKAQWEEKGFRLPQYDREAIAAATKENLYKGKEYQIIFHCGLLEEPQEVELC